MKTVRAFTFGAAILVGIVGCSTSSPKVASRHQLDATTAAAVEYAELVDEWGKMDAAEKELRTVLEVDLNNPKARYYLTLVQRFPGAAGSAAASGSSSDISCKANL